VAQPFCFRPPAIPGVGTAGGVTFLLEDRAGRDVAYLAENMQKFLEATKKRPRACRVMTTLLPSVPQVFVEVDRDKVLSQGVSLGEVYNTLQAFMGGYFVNYSIASVANGRCTWRPRATIDCAQNNSGNSMCITVRASRFRSRPLRESRGASARITMRYNLYRCAQIKPAGAGIQFRTGHQSARRSLRANHAPEMGYDYSGMSFQEQQAKQGVPASAIFALSLVFVFLILAALYESWSLPFSVFAERAHRGLRSRGALWLRRVATAAILPPFLVQIETTSTRKSA